MSRSTIRSTFTALMALALIAAASPASAQTGDTPSTARDVLPLITEEVALEQDAPPTVRYWWVSPSAPAWTASDQKIRQILRANHVDLVGLSSDLRISKIYRTPSLSRSNAATLGSLVGAKRVLVGTISYRRKAPVGPVGMQRVAASADVSLVSAESGGTTALHRFTVEREGFAATADEALEQARTAASEALATLVARTLMRGPGPVGMRTDEKLIGLHNAENGRVLQAVTEFLESLDQVDRVGVRWASEGVIALEVNPGKKDAPDAVEYAIRALANQSFEGFSLASRAHPSAGSLTEFDVAPGDREQF